MAYLFQYQHIDLIDCEPQCFQEDRALLRVPYMKRVRGVPLGVFVYVVIDTTTFIPLPRGSLVGHLRCYPSILPEHFLHHSDCFFFILVCHQDSIMDG